MGNQGRKRNLLPQIENKKDESKTRGNLAPFLIGKTGINSHRKYTPSGRHAGEITWLPFFSVSMRLAKVTVKSP